MIKQEIIAATNGSACNLLDCFISADDTIELISLFSDGIQFGQTAASIDNTLLLVSNDEIIGSVLGAFDGYRAKIYSLKVKKNNSAAATSLLKACLNRLQQLGAQRCFTLSSVEEGILQQVGFSLFDHAWVYHTTLADLRRIAPSGSLGLSIEKVAPSDAMQAWQELSLLFKKGNAWQGVADDLAGLTVFINNPGSQCFFFREHGNLVAAIYAAVDGLSTAIWHLQVDPTYQNKGFGSQIVGFLVNDHWKLDLPIYINVLRENQGAQRFWERLGFTPACNLPVWSMNLQLVCDHLLEACDTQNRF